MTNPETELMEAWRKALPDKFIFHKQSLEFYYAAYRLIPELCAKVEGLEACGRLVKALFAKIDGAKEKPDYAALLADIRTARDALKG